jgi:hypothetical protein
MGVLVGAAEVVDVGALVQQVLHHVLVAMFRCQVERRVAELSARIDIRAPPQGLLHALEAAVGGSFEEAIIGRARHAEFHRAGAVAQPGRQTTP